MIKIFIKQTNTSGVARFIVGAKRHPHIQVYKIAQFIASYLEGIIKVFITGL